MSVHRKQIQGPTGINGATVYQSATFHQGNRSRFQHDHVNAQCTGIAVVAIAAQPPTIGFIPRNFLDRILVEGDKYYLESKAANNVELSHLATDELLTSYVIFDRSVNITIEDIAAGNMNAPDRLNVIADNIQNCQRMKCTSPECDNYGFLFIAQGKTVAFKVSESEKRELFLFNSHCVNNCNRFPPRGAGLAKLFRCISAEALAKLMLGEYPHSNNYWQIYIVKVKNN